MFFGLPAFFPVSGRPSKGIISRTSCTWHTPVTAGVLQVGTLDYFSCYSLFLGCEKMDINKRRYSISSIWQAPDWKRPQANFAASEMLLSVPSKEQQHLVLSFTTTVGKSRQFLLIVLALEFSGSGFG